MKEYSADTGEVIADAIIEYADLALDTIVASPTNPRKRFNSAKMAELAASIKADEVHEPIVVRPLPAARLQESFLDRRPGAPLPTHELVSGERRWRASIDAGKTTIPARVKRYTDEQVVRIQIVENTQRADLHPMEEAEGFQHMMTLLGINADQVADEVGVSRATVYARLKLLDLCVTARDAFYAEKIDQSRALIIARVPDEQLQLKALKEACETDWQGSVPSVRRFQVWVRQHLMLDLDKARFKITDVSLVPAAGSCHECPKRTGAAPDLFADVDKADVCTDTKCFHQKQAVHDKDVATAAEAMGRTIIDGKAAKRVWEYEHQNNLNGYRRLDRPDPRVEGNKSLKKLLGKDCPEPVLLKSPHDGSLIEVVDDATVTQLLKDRGLLLPAQARATRDISVHEAKAKLEEKYNRTWRRLAIEQTYETMMRSPEAYTIGVPTIRLLAKMLLQGLVSDDRAHTAELIGVGKVADADGIKSYIETATDMEVGGVLLLLFMQHDMRFNEYAGIKEPERINAVAEDCKVDLKTIQDEVKKQMKAKAAPKKSTLAKTHAAQQMQITADPKAGAVKPRQAKQKLSAQEAITGIAEAMQGMEQAATARPEAQASEGTAKPPKTAKAKGKTVKAVSVPYKGPNGETWSGRGLQPRWVRVHIERGGKLDDLKVAA